MSYATTTYPYGTVVQITDTLGGSLWQGSGVLISPDEVLTASHVVYRTGIGTATNIVVAPGYNAGAEPYGTFNGTYFHYIIIDDQNDLITPQQSQFDYAVIHLSSPVVGAGYMGLLSNYSGGLANITGYPASAGGAQVNSTETVYHDPSYTLLDGTSLGPGSSGGPVWVEYNGGPHVVGLVSSSSGSTGYNVLITTSVFNQIEAWVSQDDAPAMPTPGPTVTSGPQDITVQGNHTQYEIAIDPATGKPVIQDTVAGRDGSQTLSALHDIIFTDGIGRFDATGNAEEVARLYQAALNRNPDAGGLDGWTAQLDSHNLGINDVAVGFIDSAEFNAKYGSLDNAGFVDKLYQNVLHRPADPSGEQGWIGQLNSGASRAHVLVGFSDSLENKLNTQGSIGDPHMDEAYRLYQAALNRAPDTPGLGGWTADLDNGMTSLQVAQGFVDSSEFTHLFAGLDTKGLVDQLYQYVLHRAPDPAGEQGWIGQLNAGASKAQVLLGFSDSLENRLNTSQATHDSWVYLPS